MAEEDTKTCIFNVGGCLYSIPISRLSCFQESLLLKESVFNDYARLFLDRDGFTFRHLHYYIHTGKLATSCISEINILYELASTLRLASLQQALENRQSGKHFLRARPVDLQVTERATMYYWKTRLCNPKQPESVASPVFTVHDAIPLGLVGKPLVDNDDEVMYCFIPLEQLRLHPNLVTQDNLLWLCNDIAIIECGSRLFRFIANFLRTGKILLPEHFGDYELLSSEAKMVGMTEFVEALQEQCEINSNSSSVLLDSPQMSGLESVAQPLYIMTFDLLVKYPDSSLGQLHIDSNLEGSRLYVTGSGVVFQHVQDWLGTCCLPLTEEASQLSGVCEYLEGQDGAYQAFKEALFQFLDKRKTSKSVFTAKPWSASVAACTVYKIVKVYVGTHWYATYLQTLLKYPELLSNSSKVNWICFGQSLHVKGDGQIFRHILNFLRSGRLLLPADFREWPLLCQEVEAFQIPALTGALEDCSDYRAWCRGKVHSSGSSSSSLATSLSLDENCFLGISSDEESMDFSEQDTQLQESPDYSYLLMADSSSRPSSEEPIVVSLPMNHSPSKSKNLGKAQGVFPGLSETSRERQAGNAGPSTASSSVSHVANTASAPGDLSSSIRSLLQKIRGTCLESLLQRLSSNISTSTQQHVAPAHRMEQESIPKERLVQILEETFKSQPNLKIKKLPGPTSPSDTGHSAGSSDSSLLAKDSESTAGGEEWSWTGHPMRGRVLQVTHLPVLGRGEPGGFFTHSVIYTGTPPDSTAHPHVTATARGDPRDVAFAHFNLSYEEMVYGREGHAFLTGIILDSKRLDTANCTQNLANLIYLLWTDQINTEEALQELLGLIGVKLHKNREKLQQWLHFTLPLARRYTECLMLLERHCCQIETLFP